jgi:hypothetical protein
VNNPNSVATELNNNNRKSTLTLENLAKHNHNDVKEQINKNIEEKTEVIGLTYIVLEKKEPLFPLLNY